MPVPARWIRFSNSFHNISIAAPAPPGTAAGRNKTSKGPDDPSVLKEKGRYLLRPSLIKDMFD